MGIFMAFLLILALMLVAAYFWTLGYEEGYRDGNKDRKKRR